MESTPVSGVEIKNDVVAPRLAPDLRSWVAVGITEHEQSGMGTPMSAAVATLMACAQRISRSGVHCTYARCDGGMCSIWVE